MKNIKIAKSRNVNYVKCGMLYFIWPKVTDNMGALISGLQIVSP